MLKRYNKIKAPLVLSLLISALFFSACNKKDEGVSSQTKLVSFGPSVNRGTDDLKFIGSNLNNVTSIVLPVGIEIPASAFKSKTSSLIVITVPDEAVSGKVTLKTPAGDIETKTDLSILEPITIVSISPASVRPGEEITIEGTYLNLIETVVFKDVKKVTSFKSQSKTTLKLIVPEDAQTGTITLLDGEEIPNAIESKSELKITLPVPTSVSPLLLKAGSQITITGTNLDLTKDVRFGGDRIVTTFVSKTATQIVVTVPANAQDGKIKLAGASGVASESSQALTMVIPTLTAITPSPAKNGANITVTGTNLDLITSVMFGGDKKGEIQSGGTATQITVKVPGDAVDGTVKFNTDANKSVMSASPVTLVVPAVTLLNPTSVSTVSAPSITITGTDLDLVTEIIFEGNWSTKTFVSQSATSITIKVVPGSVTGKVKLITTNGTPVLTPDLTIVPDVPNITGPLFSVAGSMLTLTGSNLNVIADIYFPGGKIATQFGSKTASTIEVFVPDEGVTKGIGKIKFVTSKNEIYYSPDIDFKDADALKAVIFDESVHSPFGKGGWGTPDIANTEKSRAGTISIKSTFTGGYSGGGQFGTWNNTPLSTSGTTYFAFSVYGNSGTNGKTLLVNINGSGGPQFSVTIDEGKWKDVKVALSTIGSPASINEVSFQDANWIGSVYIDQMGLK